MNFEIFFKPKERLPYRVRLRNRIIVAIIFIGLCALMGKCILSENNPEQNNNKKIIATDSLAVKDTLIETKATNAQDIFKQANSEDLENTKTSLTKVIAPPNPPEIEIIDSTHIKAQANVFMAEKIDLMLRRFKPEHAIMLIVDPNTNEIIAWGERKENKIQTVPDYFIKNTFPAASLAKTITIAAAIESNRYSLNSQIPMIGASHTLYKNQLRVKESFKGPFIEMQDAYAKSSNPPLALIGLNVGATRLKNAAKILGYNTNFPEGIPARSTYAPPDSGYGLAETSCGFTNTTTLTPLLAAAQVRAILTKKPLEIPWAKNLKGYAPTKRIALDVGLFSENTYYGLYKAMLKTVSNGTARKNISTKYMARKNYAALNIGGKTGSLDGLDPHGRYEWFMGFAAFKEEPKKAIVLVIMQVHDLQGTRSQPATQIAAMLFNYWARETLSKK